MLFEELAADMPQVWQMRRCMVSPVPDILHNHPLGCWQVRSVEINTDCGFIEIFSFSLGLFDLDRVMMGGRT